MYPACAGGSVRPTPHPSLDRPSFEEARMTGDIKVISGTAHPELRARAGRRGRGSLRRACRTLGARAIERIQASPLRQLVVTNTIPLTPPKRIERIHVQSVAPLFAEAIQAIHDGSSVSRLFR
jgi:hypothetical protein